MISNPEYKMLQMQPGDEWYLLMASDGVWEFLTPDEIVKFTAKKLRYVLFIYILLVFAF